MSYSQYEGGSLSQKSVQDFEGIKTSDASNLLSEHFAKLNIEGVSEKVKPSESSLIEI